MPKIVSVNVLGFPEKDRRMIRNILSVAGNQEAVYKWTTENSEVADIFVVNADDPGAMLFWNEYRQNQPEATHILASTSPMLESDYVCIKRPLIASQLHGALTLQPSANSSPATENGYSAQVFSVSQFFYRPSGENHCDGAHCHSAG